MPGCKPLTGTVTLNEPAPAGGVVVDLRDNLAAARIPATVTVAEGETTADFAITTDPVTADQTGTIEAEVDGARVIRSLKIRRIGVASLTLAPNPVKASNTVSGPVTLECPVPAVIGSINVAVSSSKPAIAKVLTPTVTITSPNQTGALSIKTFVGKTGKSTVKAAANGIANSKTLTVKP